MRVLCVTPAYPPFPGGGERYVAALAEELAARDHAVTVVTSTAVRERDLWQGRAAATGDEGSVRVIRCALRPFPGRRSGLLAWRKAMVLLSALPGEQTAVLRRMARRIPPLVDLDAALAAVEAVDVVHGFNISWEHALLAAQRAARGRDVPFVATPFMHFGSEHGDRVARNSTMDHQLRLLRAADRVLTLTSVEREGLLRLGLDAERVAVIGGGVAPLPDFPPPAAVQEEYAIDGPYALFVGRTSFDKGALHAAEAVLALRRAGENVRLVLAGQTTPAFERFVARLAPTEREAIRPLGVIDEGEKHALLAAAAVLLLPSRTDSLGIVLLEAWRHGRPVIGARAGGIPGVIDDGTDGLLVPFGDVAALQAALARLLADRALADRLGARGREKVAHRFTWPRVTDRVAAHYAAALEEKVAGS